MRALPLGNFERHELETLGLLGRHAARALVVSTRLAAAQRHERIAVEALAQLECAALVVDRDLNVIYANAAAERLASDGIFIRKKKTADLVTPASGSSHALHRLSHAKLGPRPIRLLSCCRGRAASSRCWCKLFRSYPRRTARSFPPGRRSGDRCRSVGVRASAISTASCACSD